MSLPENILTLKSKADPIIKKYAPSSSDKVTPVTPLLEVLTATQLSELDYPPLKWAVEGILPEGLTVLAGSPKVGKSWFCLGLAIGIASGQQVFKRINVAKGKVLYLALEDGPRRIQERLRLLNDGTSPLLNNLHIVTKLPTNVSLIEAMKEYLSENIDTRLVIIDVYARVKHTVKQQGNSYSEDYADAIKWKNLADTYNTAILLVHHTRKQIAEDFINAVSGTNGLTGAADTILRLDRARQSDHATLEITSRDAPENKLAFSKENVQWVLLGDSNLFDVSPTRRTILDIIEKKGSITPKELAESQLGITHDNAKQTLNRMYETGQVHRELGRYYLKDTQILDFS